ncbi:MAG: CDP-diacylglycerol--glycerol-3-phosphate 3-phosphatidyltransferase [Polyangiaceae bacterium]|nr:CDP-diacylglycerol--glycerol-3-phosphate 3-phosphatidyltransferase [Polyangiaceae bacterium]
MAGPAAQAVKSSFKEDALNIPNLLTMGRILVIPVFLYLLDQGTPQACVLAALVYAAAAITDFLDGWLARRMGIVSLLGKFLDPLADKLMVMASLIWMIPMGRIPAWAVVLLIGREISITGLRSIASSSGVVISAGGGGKAKTALQMLGILCLILGYPYHLVYGPLDLGWVDLVVVGRALVYLSLVFSIWSAFEYMKVFGRAVEAESSLSDEDSADKAAS